MKLTKTLFVTVANAGSGKAEDQFLNATNDATDLAEVGETVTVGRYELVELGAVTAEPRFVPRRKVR